VLLEADGDGGVLAVRYQLARDPGLISLVSAGRRGFDGVDLWEHTQQVGEGGLDVVVTSERPTQAGAAVAAAAPLGAWLAGRSDVDVIADFGRLGPASPGIELALQTDVLLMVVNPVAEQIQPAAERLQGLREAGANVGWVLVGDKPYGPAEIEATFGFGVAGVIADDRRAAQILSGGGSTRKMRRSLLFRSAAALACELADRARADRVEQAS